MSPADTPPTTRRSAAVSAILLAVFVLGYVAFALGVRPFARVHTSAVFADEPRFRGENLVDGNDATEWVPPDTTMASADIRYPLGVDVGAVVVRNGQNLPYRDRASQRLEVDLYRDGAKVRTGVLLFPTIDTREATFEVEPPEFDVDRISLRVRGFHEIGAAVAEMQVRAPAR